jgi:AraC family transcriptional regulator of adaptative response/methylated-DNA-[protein]-cysteine methyltransferase
MTGQAQLNYDKIQRAIEYLDAHFKDQPGLEEVAEQVHLSPFHFQRMFSEWAGVSPKKYLQYLSLSHAKAVLRQSQASLYAASLETGLSSASRLHDLFVNIEGMTPSEYRAGGSNLQINYSFAETPFGEVVVASTAKGVCALEFCADAEQGFAALQRQFPAAQFAQRVDDLQRRALNLFHADWSDAKALRLHLRGSEFQLQVWRALLSIPPGQLWSYGDVAHQLGAGGASRAVGSAVGKNPVAMLIPCHRVIRATGELGGYRWGTTRKKAMVGWEAAQHDLSPAVDVAPLAP